MPPLSSALSSAAGIKLWPAAIRDGYVRMAAGTRRTTGRETATVT